MSRVAAILLNYRTPELVADCLETLVTELDSELDTIVVVDNASGDGSAETIRRAVDDGGWKHVRVVEAEENHGFSAGLNLGIASVRADAYLLLNSDILIRPGALSVMRDALERDASLGLVGPRLEWPDGDDAAWSSKSRSRACRPAWESRPGVWAPCPKSPWTPGPAPFRACCRAAPCT